MTGSFQFSIAGAFAVFAASPAEALCSYNGVDYARTTIRQEFADSTWVVRAKVISARDGFVERGLPDEGMPWTVYWLKVLKAYKGTPPHRIRFFTERNSGGFYMDRPWLPLPRAHDIGGEYLLFLVPIRGRWDWSRTALGASFVNYACGQSKEWRKVSSTARRKLDALSHR